MSTSTPESDARRADFQAVLDGEIAPLLRDFAALKESIPAGFPEALLREAAAMHRRKILERKAGWDQAKKDHEPHEVQALLAAAGEMIQPKRWAQIAEPFNRDKAEKLDGIKKRLEHAERKLSQLADASILRPVEPSGEDPEADPHWVVFRKVGRPERTIAGADPEDVALCAAELAADLARLRGVPVDVVRQGTVKDGNDSFSRFDVCVCVESFADVEILKRLPGPERREVARRCWGLRVDPRHFLPLEAGYEEREEIDKEGNDLRAARLAREAADAEDRRKLHEEMAEENRKRRFS